MAATQHAVRNVDPAAVRATMDYMASHGGRAPPEMRAYDAHAQVLQNELLVQGLSFGSPTSFVGPMALQLGASPELAINLGRGAQLVEDTMLAGGALAGMRGQSGSSLRTNIEANIAESATSRGASNIEALFAKEAQMGTPYGGIDNWQMTTLPKGSTVYGGLPGQSAFYSDSAAIQNSGGSGNSLFRSLQVNPDPILGYRPMVGEFVTLRPVRIPTSTTLANPQFGAGGASQFYIRNFSQDLMLQKTIPLTKP